MRAFLLTPTHRLVDGIPEIHLYGVLENGEPCLVIEDRFRPYLFVAAARVPEVRSLSRRARIESTALRSFDGTSVARVTIDSPGEMPALRKRLEDRGIVCFEADLRFAYRYLIDHGIRGSFHIQGTHQVHARLGWVYRNPTLEPCHWVPRLKVLSIDIETDPEAQKLYSIALCTEGFERAIIVREGNFRDADHVHSEKAAIRRFLEYLHEIDPDVITGWNVVDFDLAVLGRLAHRYSLPFAIGRNEEVLHLRQEASFTRESRAEVGGRQVLDGLSLMRGAFIKLEDYKLETVAQAFLGEGKLLHGDQRHLAIDALYRDDPQRLIDYNLKDARLVLGILAKTGLVDLAIERSLLTGMPLDRVSAAIASVDSLYLHDLRHRGVVAPSVQFSPPAAPGGETRHESSHDDDDRQRSEAVGNDLPAARRAAARAQPVLIGGYVMDSKPGLFENVLVFDFKSLYPSIIRTFHLDPLTLVTAAEAHGRVVQAPNGARFRRDIPGILPQLLTVLAEERQHAKYAGNAVKANAIKILMNSFYGVLGAVPSRLFSPDVANAITTFGQLLIQHAAADARQRGFEVLYGDTDSLFVLSGEKDAEAAYRLGEQLCVDIGESVARRIRREFECESVLELEFEKLYRRFFLPEVRGGAVGSKKRYAGLLDKAGREEIEFVGLEFVRRDWSEVSKHFQYELLQRVFHDQPVEEMIRAFLSDLRAGRFDAQLVYRKAIRKDLRAYTKTTPAHVKAARKQRVAGGRIVSYIVTTHGPEPLDNLTAAPDYEHYIDHQLAPVADAILHLLGTSFDAIARPSAQLSLF